MKKPDFVKSLKLVVLYSAGQIYKIAASCETRTGLKSLGGANANHYTNWAYTSSADESSICVLTQRKVRYTVHPRLSVSDDYTQSYPIMVLV